MLDEKQGFINKKIAVKSNNQVNIFTKWSTHTIVIVPINENLRNIKEKLLTLIRSERVKEMYRN